MALARHQFTVADASGNIVPSATITVYDEATAALAAIYSDRAGLLALGNPFTADAEGFAAFYALGGAYRIDATSGLFSRTWRYVGIGTASERDANSEGFRHKLTADTTLVVLATGSDVTGDLDHPFATPQGCYDWCLENIDAAGFFVKIRINDVTGHTYTASNHRRTTDEFSIDSTVLTINANIPGAACVEFEGPITPTGNDYSTNKVKFDALGGVGVFIAAMDGLYRFQGIAFVDSGSPKGDTIFAFGPCTIGLNSVDFGEAGSYHVHVGPATCVKPFGDYSISGGAGAHFFIESAFVDHESSLVTITNTPAFAFAYIVVAGGNYALISVTFAGSATGSRYSIQNGGIGTSGGGPLDDYLPGNTPGVTIQDYGGAARTYSARVENITSGSSSTAFPAPSGGSASLVQIRNNGTGADGLFRVGAGNAITKIAGDASFEASTTPGGGNSGFGWGGSDYRIYNNTGVTRTYNLLVHYAYY